MELYELERKQRAAQNAANDYVRALHNANTTRERLVYLKATAENLRREYEQAWKDYQEEVIGRVAK